MAVWAAVALGPCGAAETRAQPIARLGAVGDSLTDEYAEESYGSYAKNWPRLLLDLRGVTMGPTAADAGLSTWGEPRRKFYQDNWARSGATLASARTQGQHTGLRGGIENRGVSHAVVFLGHNDYSPSGSIYINVYFGFWSQAQIDAAIEARVTDLRAILDEVAGRGAHVVLVSPVDVGATPAVAGVYTDPVRRDRMTAVFRKTRDRFRQLAAEYGLVFADGFAYAQAVLGPNTGLRPTLLVGNRVINLRLGGAASTNGFVGDSFHPHTVMQGLFASFFAAALSVTAEPDVAPFSESEILGAAGLAYGGADTLASQVPPARQFLVNFECRGDFNLDGVLDDFDLFDYLNAFFGGDVVADFDFDGSLDDFDLFDFLNAFNAGC
ncbi:MAG: SGNH/GDSL hydrolase family protein [Phycisphaerae bacterium]|nr:SGNH/GDSL hydrolase family protein [Phycisphaerae bacterium]